MKPLTLIALAISICLVGCNKQVSEPHVSDTKKSVKSTPTTEQVLASEAIPNGRWIHNPLHCQNELPVIGPYDFEVANNSIKYIGVTEKGTWYEDKSQEAEVAFANFLEQNESCLNANISDFTLVRFDGISTDYTLAYSAAEKIILRLKDDDVQLIVPFEIDKIKKLQIVDNSDTGVIDNENQS